MLTLLEEYHTLIATFVPIFSLSWPIILIHSREVTHSVVLW